MPFSSDLTVLPGNMGSGWPYDWTYLPELANISNDTPGSVRWWLSKGIAAISQKLRPYKTKEQYAFGPHPYPNGDRRYVRALDELQRKTQTNYISLVINSPVQRMNVKGFRFGDTQADESAKMAWMANDMDYQMESFLLDAAVYGEAYVLVGPPDPETGQPLITAECPTNCHVFPDPLKPTRALCGIRLWKDVYEERVVAVVYLPEATYVFFGPENSAEIGVISSVDNYDFITADFNEIGEVPLVRSEWRSGNRGEADDIIQIQDRINHTVLDRLLISKSQAYNQKWATGVGLSRGHKKKSSPPPFNPGSDTLWLVPDENAKFGQFEAADIKQLLEAIRDDVIDMASLTQTPAHYLMGKMANVGGDTLTQAESGFVAKVRARQRTVGWALEKVMRLVFKFSGDFTKASEIDAEVIWADPEVRTRAEQADAALKEAQVFAECPPYALAVVAARMGLDPDQIQTLVEGAEQYQQEMQQREEDMLDKQNEGAIAVAKEGGRARPATASSKSSTSSGS